MRIEEKHNNNIFSQKKHQTHSENENSPPQQQPRIDNKKTNRSLNIGFSMCGKTFLMNYILVQNQDRLRCASRKAAAIHKIKKSFSQYPIIKAQTSDEIRPLGFHGNGTLVFDDMLLLKQASNFDLFPTKGRHKTFDIYFILKLLSPSKKYNS